MKSSRTLASSSSSPTTRTAMQRMMGIHHAVQSQKFPNATNLARELGVSSKSIQRDIEFMRERMQLPLAYHDRKHGYYYTQEVSALPSVPMTEGELFAVLVAEKALQQYRGTNFEKPLLSAIRKMEQSLPNTISLNLAEWDQAISFRTRAEPILDLEMFETLGRATAQRQQLEISYRKPGQRVPDKRVVDPYHLANINGEWFLFAFDHLRKDIRTFVPARIKSLRRTGKKFHKPVNFSLEQRLRDSFGVHSAEGHFDIAIRFSPRVADYIREKRWHDSQKLVERRDGGLDLHLKLSSLPEVERWVLGWGGEAVVLQPPELAKQVRRSAARILKEQR